MSTRPILLLDCYEDEAGASATFLPYLRASGRGVQGVRVSKGQPLPAELGAFAGVAVTGSAACLPDGVDWARPVIDWIGSAIEARVPYLGVCFGHQCLAAVFGGLGAVRKMVTPEVGVVRVDVLDASDPLIGAWAPSFEVLASHEDEVRFPLSPALERLARSEACEVHAMRVRGKRAWGVQFHTEMPYAEVQALFLRRAARHPELGIDPQSALARWAALPERATALFSHWLAEVEESERELSAD